MNKEEATMHRNREDLSPEEQSMLALLILSPFRERFGGGKIASRCGALRYFVLE